MREITNYARRWWLLLLLGIVVGGHLGYIWHFQFANDARFQATATVAILGDMGDIDFQIISGTSPSEKKAIEVATKDVAILDIIAQSSAAFHDIVANEPLTMEQRGLESSQRILAAFPNLPEKSAGLSSAVVTALSVEGSAKHPAWKSVVMGGVFGLLITIGGIYIWQELVRARDLDDTPKL